MAQSLCADRWSETRMPRPADRLNHHTEYICHIGTRVCWKQNTCHCTRWNAHPSDFKLEGCRRNQRPKCGKLVEILDIEDARLWWGDISVLYYLRSAVLQPHQCKGHAHGGSCESKQIGPLRATSCNIQRWKGVDKYWQLTLEPTLCIDELWRE